MQFLRIVFLCKFLRKKYWIDENYYYKHAIFFANTGLPAMFYEKIRGVHIMEIFGMKILPVLLMLDFQFRLLKTPSMDRYLHKAMGFEGEWFFWK